VEGWGGVIKTKEGGDEKRFYEEGENPASGVEWITHGIIQINNPSNNAYSNQIQKDSRKTNQSQ